MSLSRQMTTGTILASGRIQVRLRQLLHGRRTGRRRIGQKQQARLHQPIQSRLGQKSGFQKARLHRPVFLRNVLTAHQCQQGSR